MLVARSDVQAADAQIEQAKSAHQQALEELQTKEELNRRNADIVARREIERLQNVVNGRQAAIDAATAAKQALESKLSTLLPAQKASAEAALAEAQVELDKTIIRAGVTGRVEQFALQVGDIVNPVLRPAGILIPDGAGRGTLVAGFGQIEAQVLRVGLVAAVACGSKPWRIIPMVVVQVQDYIAAGQFRGGEQLLEAQTVARPGTILAFLEPLYEGGLEGVTPGSSCIANAYTSNHELLASKDIGFFRRTGLHLVDTVGIVHAMILRIQALLLPIQTLVFGGH
ncbi:MAG: HlyD family secretion protein, partial [Pseudolabrys sp.]